ncbi:MAG: ferrochelatase [Cytophagales bacterium]|nr:MAG: ferrochelatase [Cytophagales bacterium]
MQVKTGVFLVNLGTPDSPSVADVRKYLREFLMDGRVIDINAIARFLLVNLIIAPFRASKSAKIYKKLWTERGSPLMFYGAELTELLQKELGDDYVVVLGMRYQNPSIESALEKLKSQSINKIIVIPLFPQYASASTGSALEEVMRVISKWQLIPQIAMIDSYPNNPEMVQTFADLGKKQMASHQFDHFIFTYHGLPQRQLRKADSRCLTEGCCDTFSEKNRLCYRAQCVETTRHLAKALGLKEGDFTISFQSRLGSDPWIKPYTDQMIEELVKKGKKKILVFAPSFVADCLETTIEIGEEYKELFEEKGGEHWQMVESLNVQPRWVNALKEMVLKQV